MFLRYFEISYDFKMTRKVQVTSVRKWTLQIEISLKEQ